VSSRSGWSVISVRTDSWGRKVRPITEVTSPALEKEEMAVHRGRLFEMNSLKEGAM
jgi:hypothetical protein